LGIGRGRGSPRAASCRPADRGWCRGSRGRGIGRGVGRGVGGRLLLHPLLLLLLRLQVVQDIRLNKRDDKIRVLLQCCGSGSVIRCIFDPWIRDPGWVKDQDLDPGSRSGMNIPDHISESLKTIFWVKILKILDADPVSGMEKHSDPGWKNSDLGSEINIPDPLTVLCISILFRILPFPVIPDPDATLKLS
jgi:hypothetical protein